MSETGSDWEQLRALHEEASEHPCSRLLPKLLKWLQKFTPSHRAAPEGAVAVVDLNFVGREKLLPEAVLLLEVLEHERVRPVVHRVARLVAATRKGRGKGSRPWSDGSRSCLVFRGLLWMAGAQELRHAMCGVRGMTRATFFCFSQLLASMTSPSPPSSRAHLMTPPCAVAAATAFSRKPTP